MMAPHAWGRALLWSHVPCLARAERRGPPARLLAAQPPSWRTALPAAPAGGAAVVAPAGTAAGAPCLLVLGEESSQEISHWYRM